MAEFLVRTENEIGAGFDPGELARLRSAERERAMELRRAGHLKRLWRVPGRWATIGRYEATDATELHEIRVSLPMWAHTSVQVEALAQHPQEQSWRGIPGRSDAR